MPQPTDHDHATETCDCGRPMPLGRTHCVDCGHSCRACGDDIRPSDKGLCAGCRAPDADDVAGDPEGRAHVAARDAAAVAHCMGLHETARAA